MGGLIASVVQGMGNQNPPDDLEQKATQAPQQLAQALQQQQQAPQQQAQQPQPSQPDQVAQGLQAAAQHYQQQLQENTPKPMTGGPVRNFLQRFFAGGGQALLKDVGLPTPYEKQQQAITGLQGIANAQGMLALHQQMASQYAPVPLVGMDGKPITDPTTGQVISLPANHAQTFYAGQAAAAGRVQAAQVGAVAKITAAQMQIMATSGQLSRLVPAVDADGNTVMRALNKFGQPIGDIEGAIPPTSYLPKSTTTGEWKQLEDGSYVQLPKTTTTHPVIPGVPAQVGGQGGQGGQGQGARVVGGIATLDGKPILGKGGITVTTKTMAETAPKVEELAQRLLGHIDTLEKSGDLGPGMSRWNEFWSGKVGTDNPEFRRMMTDSSLLSTLLMRMHTGSRGAVQMMTHFDNILAAGHQSPANMRASIDEILQYARDVKGSAPLPKQFGNFNQPANSADPFAQFGGRKR